jgi:pyrroline-5-carboxylate reductase
MNYKIGFIGCGNMGGVLAEKVLQKIGGKDVALSDLNTEKLNELTSKYSSNAVDNKTLVSSSKFIVLGVKPQVAKIVIDQIKDDIFADAVIISMMAGQDILTVQNLFNKKVKIIRIMPNMPCKLGQGVIAYSTSENVTKEEEDLFNEYFSMAGLIDKVDESLMDAVTALSGSGPAFVYAFAKSLIDGAVKCGFSKEKATLYATKTVIGAGKMLDEFKDADALIKAVCSPNGTTLAGISELEKGNLYITGENAVISACKRAEELRK